MIYPSLKLIWPILILSSMSINPEKSINHVQRLSWSTDQAFKFHVEDLFWSNSPPNTHASEEKMIIEHPRILEIVAVDLQR
ncbi:hypothetical protein YC2023_110121 [Brassica napus]